MASILLPIAALIGSVSVRAQLGLSLFLDTYQCGLINQLNLIHENKSRAKDRFIMLSADRAQRYVQCMFFDADTKILCEASSGFHGPRSGTEQTFRVSDQGLESLARLGFSTDGTAGNFHRVFRPPAASDFRAVSAVILTALYEVHGADTASGFWIRAPLGEPTRMVPAQCVPTG